MITRQHAFLVIGLPVPQGDLTCSRGPNHRLYHQNKVTLEPWRQRVAAAAKKWCEETADEAQPLEAVLTWSLPRPKGHYGTGRNADALKPSAPLYPSRKPDLDKLTRAVFDALTESKVTPDDAQIVDATVKKRYASAREVNIPIGHPGPDVDDVLPCPGLIVRLYPKEDHAHD